MTRLAVVAVVLLALAAGVCAAGERYRPIMVSAVPAVAIPLPPDHRLFEPGGGVAARVGYVLPFFQPLSAGVGVVYDLGPMQHPDLGNLGSLSLVSAEAAVELRLTFLRRIDAYLGGGVGWFYAVLNGDSSQWVSNIALGGRLGVGLRVSPRLCVGVQGEYRRYQSLYHLIAIGVGVDFWLGGVS